MSDDFYINDRNFHLKRTGMARRHADDAQLHYDTAVHDAQNAHQDYEAAEAEVCWSERSFTIGEISAAMKVTRLHQVVLETKEKLEKAERDFADYRARQAGPESSSSCAGSDSDGSRARARPGTGPDWFEGFEWYTNAPPKSTGSRARPTFSSTERAKAYAGTGPSKTAKKAQKPKGERKAEELPRRKENEGPPKAKTAKQPTSKPEKITALTINAFIATASLAFADYSTITAFPDPPSEPCHNLSCTKAARALKARPCNLRKVFKMVENPGKERRAWHPDRFACVADDPVGFREECRRKAGEVFVGLSGMM
ncbi:hypothetical protein LTR86_002449 [Recurvomyces mirabilis]|nr:hypothetical protein LTR86_002449 [Recurvomyces mirabilis]